MICKQQWRNVVIAIFAAFVGAVSFAGTPAIGQTFLGLNPPAGCTSDGNPSISADGTVIAGTVRCGGFDQSYRQTYNPATNRAGAATLIPHTPLTDTSGRSAYSSVFAVSNPQAGPVVVVGSGSVYQPPYVGSQSGEAYRWTAAGGMAGIGYITGPNLTTLGSTALGVNAGVPGSVAGGTVVVGDSVTIPNNQSEPTTHAFRWTSSGMRDLGFLPGSSESIAHAVTPNGAVVAGVSCVGGDLTGRCQPFRWTSTGGMTGLGFLPNYPRAEALAVNSDGSVIVGGADNNAAAIEAFRWTAKTGMQAIGPGAALAVDTTGNVIAGTKVQGNSQSAFIWYSSKLGEQSLATILAADGADLAGWTLMAASGISSDGRVVVGTGMHQGRRQDWVARLRATSSTCCLVVVGASPSDGGSVKGGGQFPKGSRPVVTAIAKQGFVFQSWMEGQTVRSNQAAFQLPALTRDWNLVAHFVARRFTIRVQANPVAGGTVTGGGTFSAATAHTVVANAKPGYVFVNWTEGSTVLGTAPAYTFTLYANRNLTANFKRANFKISVSVSPAGTGGVQGGGTFPANGERAVSAVSKTGYDFVNWTEHGSVVSDQLYYQFKLTRDRELVANFTLGVKITATASPASEGSAFGTATIRPGGAWDVWAKPKPGFGFVSWTEKGSIVSSDLDYSFIVHSARNLIANFASGVTVSTSIDPSNSGLTFVTGGAWNEITDFSQGTIGIGGVVEVHAIPSSAAWVFDNWTENGVIVSSSSTYRFHVKAGTALVAHFSPF